MIALDNIDWSRVFEPARSKTHSQTHVFTETTGDCNVALADVM